MQNWNAGYVTDQPYISHYLHLLSPLHLRLALLIAGADLPARNEDEPLRYLELGYGQGTSLNIHAAANQDAEFWGTDFMPEHTLHAKDIAYRAKINTQALNHSFAELDELAQAKKLPLFDIIVMHGIWSWINDENRRHILNIINSRLKPGGIVYVSYNSEPGRSTLTPIRELMALHAERKSTGKNSQQKAEEASQLIQALDKAKAALFSSNATYGQFVQTLPEKPVSYLAHEFLNQDWQSFYFATVAKDMASADCFYGTSAGLPRAMASARLCGTQPLINLLPDAISQETIIDYSINTAFRSDIFIKKGPQATPDECQRRLGNMHFSLNRPLPYYGELTISTPISHFVLDRDYYTPFLQVLAENNYQPKNAATLHAHPSLSHLAYEDILSSVHTLFGGNHIFPAIPSPPEKTAAACRRLNRVLCGNITGNVEHLLVSPVLGIASNIHNPSFLWSYASGKTDPRDWADDTRAIMASQGKTVTAKKGKTDKKKTDTLLEEAQKFEKITLPFLEAIGALIEPE